MPAMTVQNFTVKTDEQGNPKKDNYGNTQMMIKFAEHPETVYKAVKDPSSITEGKVMYGQVVEGQYGFKFQADPYNQPGQAPSRPFQPAQTPSDSLSSVHTSNQLDVLLEITKATYRAVTGEDYSGVKRETTSTEKPHTQATVSSDVPPVDAYDNLPEPDFGV